MNDRSATTASTGPPIWSGSSERTLVRSTIRTRSSFCSRQTSWPVPDVDRHHLARAAPQQHVGEAAGRRAGIEEPPAGHYQRRVERRAVLQRAEQLVRAAGRPLLTGRLVHDDRGRRLHTGRRLGRHDPRDPHPAVGDRRGGLLPAAREATPDELGVQPRPAGHR
jgi:hypothetical protein